MQGKDMSAQQKIKIETPVGTITAMPKGTPNEYPGIRILINETTYVYVEYDNVKEAIHVVTYDETNDDPKEVYELPKQ